MLKINQVNSVNTHKNNTKSNVNFASNSCTQVNSLPDAYVDYNVKKPTNYLKTGVVNLPNDLKAHCYKLENGQQIVLVPKTDSVTVVKTYVNTGSMNEPDEVRGISHYIEHNLFNGSEGLSAGEFFDTTVKMGANTNASTGFARTDYYISSNLLNEGDLENKIKIHASMLETPKFALDMLEKEKGIVNSEINMYQGYADNIAFNLTLKKLFNIKSTSPDLIAGTETNINNITREDVVDYYNNNYYPANMVTVVTGDVEPEETIKLIAKYFKGTNKSTHPRKFENLIPIDKTVRQDIYSDKTFSTRTIVGFSGPTNDDVKSKVCLSIIDSLLNSYKTGSLYKSLEQYNTSSSLTIEKIGCRPYDPTAIMIETETNEKDCQKVLQEIFNQVHKISLNPNFDEELQAIKKNNIILNNLSYEKSFLLNDFIGKSILNNRFDYVVDYDKIVNSITKQDIMDTAKKYLNLEKAVVTVVHPEPSNISFTGNVNKKRGISAENISHYRLNNNVEVVVNNTNNETGAINCEFKMDYNPAINPASVMVLNAMLAEGSLYRDANMYNKDLRKDAINISFSTASNNLSSGANCLSYDMPKALSSTLEVLYNPRLTPETLNKVKRDIIELIQRQDKSPYDKFNREVFDGLSIAYYGDELIDYVNKLTLDDVKSLHTQLISNSKLNVVVSGPFHKNPSLKQYLLSSFNRLPMVKPSIPTTVDTYKPIKETKVLTEISTKEQADILEAFTFRFNGNIKDAVAIKLLNIILGSNSSSRLFTDLREKQQLAYHVGSNFSVVDNIGIFELNIGTTTENSSLNKNSYENIQKSIDGFNKHINKIKTEYVTEQELKSAKLQYKNQLLTALESNIAKNASMLEGMSGYYGELESNKILEIIDTITEKDIYNAANYVFAGKPMYSILAKENTLKANEEYFKTLI